MGSNSTTLAYCAGVIDSDGTIGVRHSNGSYFARVQVKQVTPQAVDLLHKTFAGYRFTTAPQAEGRRPLHGWAVHSRSAGSVLRAVLPFLRIKVEQAENGIACCELATAPRRHPVPPVVKGEPLLSIAEAAEALGRSYQVVWKAVRAESVPFVTRGGRPMIPASFIPTWAARPNVPSRSPESLAAMEACYQRSLVLNRVGV